MAKGNKNSNKNTETVAQITPEVAEQVQPAPETQVVTEAEAEAVTATVAPEQPLSKETSMVKKLLDGLQSGELTEEALMLGASSTQKKWDVSSALKALRQYQKLQKLNSKREFAIKISTKGAVTVLDKSLRKIGVTLYKDELAFIFSKVDEIKKFIADNEEQLKMLPPPKPRAAKEGEVAGQTEGEIEGSETDESTEEAA